MKNVFILFKVVGMNVEFYKPFEKLIFFFILIPIQTRCKPF